jgi:hypothetical protein
MGTFISSDIFWTKLWFSLQFVSEISLSKIFFEQFVLWISSELAVLVKCILDFFTTLSAFHYGKKSLELVPKGLAIQPSGKMDLGWYLNHLCCCLKHFWRTIKNVGEIMQSKNSSLALNGAQLMHTICSKCSNRMITLVLLTITNMSNLSNSFELFGYKINLERVKLLFYA